MNSLSLRLAESILEDKDNVDGRDAVRLANAVVAAYKRKNKRKRKHKKQK